MRASEVFGLCVRVAGLLMVVCVLLATFLICMGGTPASNLFFPAAGLVLGVGIYFMLGARGIVRASYPGVWASHDVAA